jgi:hypothetical protein
MRTKFAIALAIAVVCATIALAGWANEEQITNNKLSNDLRLYNGDKVVVASNGVRHLVWTTGSGVYYKRYYPGSGWTSDYKLTKDASSSGPSIALDANGTDIHVVWAGKGVGSSANRSIYYQKCVPGPSGNGGWVGTPRVIGSEGHLNFTVPAVACYQGHIVVTWSTGYSDSVAFCECVNGNWGAPSYFLDPPALAWYPSIAVDPQDRCGDVFICYGRTNAGPAQACCVLRRHNGVWQQREVATGGNVGYGSPCVEVDPVNGYPHVFCRSSSPDYSICHTYWDPGLGWQPPEVIAGQFANSYGGHSAIFSGGSAYVVWPETSPDSVPGIKYSVGQYGNWTAPDWVTSGYSDLWPGVAARANGDVFVVWQDGRTKIAQIWGRLYSAGSFSGQAEPKALSQSGVELFPNPAKAGRVTVQYALLRAEPLQVTVCDVSGRAVRTQEVSATRRTGALSIDLGDLNAGVYVVRITGSNLTTSRKLVVQR